MLSVSDIEIYAARSAGLCSLRGIFRDVIFARNKESESFSRCLQRGVIPGRSRKGKRTEGVFFNKND
jgi:hypothetical protein